MRKITTICTILQVLFFLTSCQTLNVTTANALEQHSILFARAGDYEELLNRYSWVLFEYPDTIFSRCNRSAVLNKVGLYYEALEDATYAQSLDPTVKEIPINIENANTGIRNTPNRIDTYNKAVKTYPKKAFPYLYRGKYLLETGNYESALQDFDKASKLLLKSDFFFRETMFYSGCTYSNLNDYQQAIESFKKVKSYYSKWPYYGYEIAYAYFKNQQYKKALSLINKSIQEVDSEKDFILLRFKIYMGLHDLKKADKELSRLIEIVPEEANELKYKQEELRKLIR